MCVKEEEKSLIFTELLWAIEISCSIELGMKKVL